MKKIITGCLFSINLLWATPSTYYHGTLTNADYQICFTPSQIPRQCTDLLISMITKAKKIILVQAYAFTSKPIINSLINAHKHGVKIIVILDKTDTEKHYNRAKIMLEKASIPVYIDNKVSIAHNKVMILDEKIVITGSFNYTYSAQKNNAENLLIINDFNLAQHYQQNFQNRLHQSQSLTTFCTQNLC